MSKVGIIDVGSNSIRLVIYEKNKGLRYKEIENIKAVARLRNYLNGTGILDDEGVQVLIETLQSFQVITRHHQLTEVKCVGTAAIRQAVNQEYILDMVSEKTDFTMTVLSEYEEAYYGFLAVVNSTSFENGITVDIGGGSTEITLFQNRKLKFYHSFPFGVISLKKQFFDGEVPTYTELLTLRSFLERQFKGLHWIMNQSLPIIGIGGSARNVVQIHQQMRNYPIAGLHQFELNGADIDHISETLTPLTITELQKIEGLSKDRADVIIPAIEVFNTILQVVRSDRFILSKKGLREGLFYKESMKSLPSPILSNVIEESFHDLALDYEVSLDQVHHSKKIATTLYHEVCRNGTEIYDEKDLFYLKKAAVVFNIGEYIDTESSSQHTFYLLANRTIDGLSHRERLIISLLASYKSKDSFKQFIYPYESWFSKEEQRKLRLLGSLLKFSFSLNSTKRRIVKDIKMDQHENTVIITVYCDQDWRAEQYQAEKVKRQVEKAIRKFITVKFLSYHE
ncbi:Ppx/GppA phosphatase family protein [Bacillus sp. AK128]